MKKQIIKAGLYVVSTPIGNLEDITLRAIRILQECDFIICENSKITGKLLKHLNIRKSLIIYNDHSNLKDREKILNYILQNKSLALISDAGTPLISDPGYKLINFLIENNCQIFSVPGPCSVIASLSISGIASNKFLFSGFIPQAKSAKENFFRELQNINYSLIFFESPNRLVKTLEIMLKIFGNKNIAVAREITKIYEEVKKNKIEDILEYYKKNLPKGEIIIILDNNNSNQDQDYSQNIKAAIEYNSNKMRPKDLADLISKNFNISKKLAYQKILQNK